MAHTEMFSERRYGEHLPLDQDEYAKSYSGLTKRYQALQKRYTTLTQQREEKQFKADVLSEFLFELGELERLDTEWSDARFQATVDHITVYNDGRLVFTFRNGSEEVNTSRPSLWTVMLIWRFLY